MVLIPLDDIQKEQMRGSVSQTQQMEKVLNAEMRVNRRGNAAKLGLRVKGKRNKLGLPLNRRRGIQYMQDICT